MCAASLAWIAEQGQLRLAVLHLLSADSCCSLACSVNFTSAVLFACAGCGLASVAFSCVLQMHFLADYNSIDSPFDGLSALQYYVFLLTNLPELAFASDGYIGLKPRGAQVSGLLVTLPGRSPLMAQPSRTRQQGLAATAVHPRQRCKWLISTSAPLLCRLQLQRHPRLI
jgi:hypothetical protein